MATKYFGQIGANKLMQIIKSALTGKVDKVSGKGLSTNDYTTAEKTKLDGIAAGAEVNVQADWSETGTGSDAYIKNKPTKLSQFSNDAGFITDADIPEGAAASTATPMMDGTAAVGTSNAFARGDHVHPSDTSKASKEYVTSMIASAISGVYTPKGTVAFASLPEASASNKGWVYNISGAFTTTAAFVEGAGHSYGAGTNVVCVDAGSGAYKWDVLAGTIDLTELTAAEVQTIWDSV